MSRAVIRPYRYDRSQIYEPPRQVFRYAAAQKLDSARLAQMSLLSATETDLAVFGLGYGPTRTCTLRRSFLAEIDDSP